MAFRMALFRPAPHQRQQDEDRKTKPSAKQAQTRQNRKSASAPPPDTPWYRRTSGSGTAKATTKATTKAKTTPKSTTGVKKKTVAKPKARTGRTGPATKAAPKARTAPKTGATPKAAPRTSRPPVLQRESIGPVLARAAVMAVALVCMVGFAVALAKVTLVPSPASDSLVHTNLRPGASIRAYLDQPQMRDSIKQVGGNIVLGVPFGVLLPMLFPRARGLVRVVLLTALVMVLVESAQGAIVEGRAFDIDDVILNTSGALLGYLLLGRRLGRALHPRREHWWHRFRVTRDRPPARTRQ